jgi:polyhydroxyalkanoate synthesis regulator phasin
VLELPTRSTDVTLTPDEALNELRDIRARLDELPEDDPHRIELLARRDELREAAAIAADMSRNPQNLRHDLARLEQRLTELNAEPIIPKRSDHPRRTRYLLNNPFVYASKINAEIEDATEDERETLERRIAELRRRIAQLDPPERPSS